MDSYWKSGRTPSRMLQVRNIRSLRLPRLVRESSSYAHQVSSARKACSDSLRQFDKSSHVLTAYVPAPARDCFMALRAFNIEVSKISGNANSQVNTKLKSTIGVSSSDLRVKFWEELLYKVFQNPFSDQVIGEPVALLLRDALRQGLNLDISYFSQILVSRNEFLKRQQFHNVEELCSYGEGLYSQLNYLHQNLLLSEQLSPSTIALVEESEPLRDKITEIAAHLGQATGVASIVLATEYNAKYLNTVFLPIDVMTNHGLSQEDVLRLFQGHLEEEMEKKMGVKNKLKDVVYDVSITANDHLLTARSKLEEVKELIKGVISGTNDPLIQNRQNTWKKGVPDCLFVPFMSAIPLAGYLQLLEKNDFDLVKNKIENPYWKIVWNTYRSYQKRRI